MYRQPITWGRRQRELLKCHIWNTLQTMKSARYDISMTQKNMWDNTGHKHVSNNVRRSGASGAAVTTCAATYCQSQAKVVCHAAQPMIWVHSCRSRLFSRSLPKEQTAIVPVDTNIIVINDFCFVSFHVLDPALFLLVFVVGRVGGLIWSSKPHTFWFIGLEGGMVWKRGLISTQNVCVFLKHL